MNTIKIIFLWGLILLSNIVMSQCTAPLDFTTQSAMDAYFTANPNCVNLGTVQISNNVDTDIITNLNSLSNVQSIDSLILLNYSNTLDVSGLNNLTNLGSLSTLMIADFSFCANITNMNYIHIEYHNDLNILNIPLDFSGFDGLESAIQINLGFNVPNSNYVDIFPNLTSLHTLDFEPWFYNPTYYTIFGTLDGFHALEFANTVRIGQFNSFLCDQLSICNSLVTLYQLNYFFGQTNVFNSFQNTQTIEHCYIHSESQEDITLPQLQQCTSLELFQMSNDSYSFPLLQTANAIAISYGGYTLVPNPMINISMPQLISCNNFSVEGYPNPNDFTPLPTNFNFNLLETVSNNFSLIGTDLIDLSLFASLTTIGGDLTIIYNSNLSDCNIEVSGNAIATTK